MLKCGYYFVPYSSLESIIEKDKESYYLALRRSQQSLKKDNPDYQTWLLFFFRSLYKQATQLKLKVSQEHVVQSRLPELSASILHNEDADGITIVITGPTTFVEKLAKDSRWGTRELAEILSEASGTSSRRLGDNVKNSAF